MPGYVVTADLAPGQLDTFPPVDEHGRLLHYWYTPAEGWRAETLGVGCIPGAPVGLLVRWTDGNAHVFAPIAGGGQLHRYYDGKAWQADTQGAPA